MNHDKTKPDIENIADALQENPEITATLQPITNDVAQAHFDAHAFTDDLTAQVIERGGTDQTIGEALKLREQLEQEQQIQSEHNERTN